MVLLVLPGKLTGGPQGQEEPGLCSYALSQNTNKQNVLNSRFYKLQKSHGLVRGGALLELPGPPTPAHRMADCLEQEGLAPLCRLPSSDNRSAEL